MKKNNHYLKLVLVVITISLALVKCKPAQDPEFEISKFVTFAKVYGYVKYFHPSDEASQIDWDKFAIYGASQIEKCQNKEALYETLQTLFEPISPALKISWANQENNGFDLNTIIPPDTSDYLKTYWQHQGVSLGVEYFFPNRYKSVRVNSSNSYDASETNGNLWLYVDAKPYRGKRFKASVRVKGDVKSLPFAAFWTRVDDENERSKFYENKTYKQDSLNSWETLEFEGELSDKAKEFALGAYLYGKGKIYIDDLSLQYFDENEWHDISVENGDFETGGIATERVDRYKMAATSGGYNFQIEDNVSEGGKMASISRKTVETAFDSLSIFETYPAIENYLTKDLGNGILCYLPLVLYTNKEKGSFPSANVSRLVELKNQLAEVIYNPSDVGFTVGNVINTFNVFQHFYPYFEEVQVDFEEALKDAIGKSLVGKSMEDHLSTLRQFTAKLRDGHISVRRDTRSDYSPPVRCEWIEGQLIISDVMEEGMGVLPGDLVTHVDGIAARQYYDMVDSEISAATDGYLNFRRKLKGLNGIKGSSVTLTVNGKQISFQRKMRWNQYHFLIQKQRPVYEGIDKETFYLNFDRIKMEEIDSLLPSLLTMKTIICDMRGYPRGLTPFISNLLPVDDTTQVWLKIPQYIYPDQENIVGYAARNWELKNRKPYLGDKNIIFITNSQAISHAESYMGYIKSYKLATIVGQPTAGTNGNVNPFILPSGIKITWTGMKVINHDGTRFHGVGILPDVYVEKTIEGVKEGRDELLEKAIELAEK